MNPKIEYIKAVVTTHKPKKAKPLSPKQSNHDHFVGSKDCKNHQAHKRLKQLLIRIKNQELQDFESE